jgi:hypothetical protein
MHEVHRGRNSIVSLKRPESLRILRSSARRALSECISAQENRIVERSVEGRYSARRALRKCASRHSRGKNS